MFFTSSLRPYLMEHGSKKQLVQHSELKSTKKSLILKAAASKAKSTFFGRSKKFLKTLILAVHTLFICCTIFPSHCVQCYFIIYSFRTPKKNIFWPKSSALTFYISLQDNTRVLSLEIFKIVIIYITQILITYLFCYFFLRIFLYNG